MTFALGFANSSAVRWSLVSASSPLLWASARMPECPGFRFRGCGVPAGHPSHRNRLRVRCLAAGGRADWANASAEDWRGVSANYYETRHIPLRRGREFTPADEKNQSTMIINEVMARKFWPEADPIGKTLLNRDYRSPLEIIGIVGDVRGAGMNAQAKPEMYTPLRGFWYAFLVLRTKRGP